MIDITFDSLLEKQSSLSNCVILIYTNMCGTCDSAKKMLHIVNQTMTDIPVYQINANSNPNVLETYKIMSIPCFLFYKNGQLVDKFYAFHSVTFLYQKIKTLFNDTYLNFK